MTDDCRYAWLRGTVPLAVAFAPTLAVAADWTRVIHTGKGDWVDKPLPHSLAYFTAHPILHDENCDLLCCGCTPEKRLAEARKSKTKVTASVRRVGILKGFAVFDVLYFVDDYDYSTSLPIPSNGKPDWKAIIVRTASNQFREIYHLQLAAVDAEIYPSVVVHSGSGTILASWASVGGNKGMTEEDYFWFDRSGAPIWMDLSPILEAAKAAAPAGKSVYNISWGGIGSFPKLTFGFPIRDDNSSLCCSGDSVDVKITLDHGKIIVTSAQFNPAK